MNKNIGLVSLFASALLFSAACSSDDKVGGEGDTVDAANPTVDAMGGGDTVDAAPTPDSAPAPDATPSALDCVGAALPTVVANPPITVAGDVQEVTLSGAGALTDETHIGLHNIVDDTVIVEGDFTGTFSLVDPTNSATPLDAYIKATVSGHVDTYIFPGTALSENIDNAPLLMLSNSVFGFLPTFSGVPAIAGTGTFTTAVVDCNNDPIAGAVLTISPDMGTVQYGDASGLPNTAGGTETLAAGVVYIFNVPPGEYTISVDVGGTAMRSNTVKSFANGVSTIQIVP